MNGPIITQGGLVLEAMNNLVIEVFDVYSRICNGIAQVLLKIYESPAKTEASLALRVVQKAAAQVEDLCEYLEICREMGVLNASQCPKLEKIPEEDIKELEQIINGKSNNGKRKINNNNNNSRDDDDDEQKVEKEEKMGMIFLMREREINEGKIMSEVIKKGSKRVLKTVITDKWEIFDNGSSQQHPFETSSSSHFTLVSSQPNYKQDLPDLITF